MFHGPASLNVPNSVSAGEVVIDSVATRSLATHRANRMDWVEDYHDVCVMAEDGMVLGKRRVRDSVAGIGDLHGQWPRTLTMTTR